MKPLGYVLGLVPASIVAVRGLFMAFGSYAMITRVYGVILPAVPGWTEQWSSSVTENFSGFLFS